MAKLFPAKILLAGEYTVIHGGHALAIPFLSYGGRWSSLSNGLENRMLDIYQALIKSRSSLPWLDFKTWYSEIHLGKYFSSNIPEGYGLGSSGALCAGIYERYLTDEQSITLTELKKRLATLENVFHGHSSGLDPLVSFVQRPLVASTGGITSRDNIFYSKDYCLFLVDSGTPRKAEFLIRHFQIMMEEKTFATDVHEVWMPAVEQLIASWIDPDAKETNYWNSFRTISQWQLAHMSAYLTEKVRTWWSDGLSSGQFLLKLCGAGGGGYYLGTCPSDEFERLATQLPLVAIHRPIPSAP